MRSGGRHRSTWFPLATSLVAASVLAALSWVGMSAGVLNGLRLQTSDALFPSEVTDDRLVVVGIDRASILKLGLPWPWPRNVQADLVRRLSDGSARLQIFDAVHHPATEHDSVLSTAIADAGNVVVASIGALVRRPSAPAFVVPAATQPVAPIADAAARMGQASVTPDPADGVVRSLPVVVQAANGDLLPSLTLGALMELESLEGPIVVRPRGVQVGDRFVPTGRLAVLDVNFSDALRPDADDVPYVSAADVLSGRVGRERLEGKIVLIGLADSTLGDTHLTPTTKTVGAPGVFVHANALNTMLTRAYLAPESRRASVGWVFLLAFVVALATQLVPLWSSPLLALVVAAGYVLLAFVRFDRGRVMDLVYPLLAAAIAFAAALAFRYLTEVRQRRRVASLFSEYVPERVARQLIDERRVDAAVAGQRAEVTVLFCDLRGFTAMAATMAPAAVRDLLNVYYRHTGRLVLEREGTLMQYVGDEVFAVFGVPLAHPDGPAAAVECALAIQGAATDIAAELGRLGVEGIRYGIGVHTGEVVAAHVGSEIHRQYAVVGDAVNVGARLCSVAGAGEIVVSGPTYSRLPSPPRATLLTDLNLKGVGSDLVAYRLNV